VNNTLIDAWFTVEQLKDIKAAVEFYCEHFNSGVVRKEELNNIIEHLDHLIKHYE